eukprot:47651-Pleurochrysis_carterae.AAC.1
MLSIEQAEQSVYVKPSVDSEGIDAPPPERSMIDIKHEWPSSLRRRTAAAVRHVLKLGNSRKTPTPQAAPAFN